MTMVRRFLTARFDLWETFLIAAAATLILWRLLTPLNPAQSEREMNFFKEHYGPGHATEREEEWMIRDFFQDRRGGFFVDVGANHYRWTSKTYYLETTLGWSGLAIEPQQQYAADYLSTGLARSSSRSSCRISPMKPRASTCSGRVHWSRLQTVISSASLECQMRSGPFRPLH